MLRNSLINTPLQRGYVFSVSQLSLLPLLPSGRGGPGRGGTSPDEARTPPSPTLPPLVPRGEREKLGEYAKHRLSGVTEHALKRGTASHLFSVVGTSRCD